MPAFTERAAGERLFVDYAGHTIDVIDPMTGEVRPAQLFVAALGASSYTFVEATWTQSLPDWIASHVRAFGFLGGVTAQIVSPFRQICFANRLPGNGQPEGRGHQGMLLRPCDQLDLWGSGRALRHGRGSGAPPQTKR
jgi:transposase